MAEVAGAAMQQVAEPFDLGAGERGMDGMRARRPLLQRRRPPLVEGVDGVAHGLVVAAQGTGDRQRWLAPAAGEQDLAAAQHKRIGGPQPGVERGTLLVGQGSDKDRWFHTTQDSALPMASSEVALGPVGMVRFL